MEFVSILLKLYLCKSSKLQYIKKAQILDICS